MSDAPIGHIKISRKTFDSDPFWLERRRFSKWEAWVDLIRRANYAPRQFSTGYGVLPVGRGEVIGAVRELAKDWNWGKSTALAFMQRLEKSGRITGLQSGQWGTLYLIVNYDTYQSSHARDRTPDRTPERPPPGHHPDKKEEEIAGEAEKQKQKHSPTATSVTWLTPVCDAWESVLGVGTFASLAKQAAAALAPLKRAGSTPEDMGARLSVYLAATAHEPKFRSITRFAQTFGQWAPTNGHHTNGATPVPPSSRGAILWPLYRRYGLTRNPNAAERARIGLELVTAGVCPTVEAFEAEFRVIQPHTLADARTDHWGISQIDARLAGRTP